MPSYRLGETIVKVHNPLPVVTMEELVEDAGLQGLWSDTGGSGFDLSYKWSQGAEREEIVVRPGETVELPISIANLAYSSLQGNGLVMFVRDARTGEWPEPGSPQWNGKCIEGLQRARQFYMTRGTIPLSKARVRHGVQTDEQWGAIKIKFKGGLINKAREDRISAEQEKLGVSRAGKKSARIESSEPVKIPA